MIWLVIKGIILNYLIRRSDKCILMQTGDELELIDKKINVISQTKEIPSPMDQAA